MNVDSTNLFYDSSSLVLKPVSVHCRFKSIKFCITTFWERPICIIDRLSSWNSLMCPFLETAFIKIGWLYEIVQYNRSQGGCWCFHESLPIPDCCEVRRCPADRHGWRNHQVLVQSKFVIHFMYPGVYVDIVYCNSTYQNWNVRLSSNKISS